MREPHLRCCRRASLQIQMQALTPASANAASAAWSIASFAPRPPSRELSGWLTVISSMGISPVRVSCRPTAGSIIVTWCASSPYREQPCIWGWSDRSPTLEEFHTLIFFSVFLSGRIMADRLYGSSHRHVSG